MAASISKKLKMDKNMHIEKDTRTQDDIIDISCYVLTNFPQILKLIFRCLPAKSLNYCARVCKVWNNVAEKIKKSRFPFYWDFFECEEDDEDSKQQLIESIQFTIENLPIVPETMLVFYSDLLVNMIFDSDILKSKTRSQRRVKKGGSRLLQFFQELLPNSCQTTAVVTDGVVGTSSDFKKTEEIENKYALSFICFAKLSNFSFHPMLFDDDQGTQLGELWNSNEETCSYLQSLEAVKSVLFFTDKVTCPQEFVFALFKEYNQPLISGAFVNQLIIPKQLSNKSRAPTICCVALCGDNVKIASVIIKDDVYSKAEVEECMKELKSHCLPEEKSFALMFACVGRGEYHYGEDNVESAIFRKYFPKTPLLGLFGRGEVGFKFPLPLSVSKSLETVDKEEDEVLNVSQKYLTHPPKLYHAYTTVLCLVSLT